MFTLSIKVATQCILLSLRFLFLSLDPYFQQENLHKPNYLTRHLYILDLSYFDAKTEPAADPGGLRGLKTPPGHGWGS